MSTKEVDEQMLNVVNKNTRCVHFVFFPSLFCSVPLFCLS